MRRLLRTYIALVIGATAVMLAVGPSRLPSTPHAWSWVVVISLAVLSAAAQYMQFQVARGWYSTAGAVPAIAAALLLPPGRADQSSCPSPPSARSCRLG